MDLLLIHVIPLVFSLLSRRYRTRNERLVTQTRYSILIGKKQKDLGLDTLFSEPPSAMKNAMLHHFRAGVPGQAPEGVVDWNNLVEITLRHPGKFYNVFLRW